jgi:lysozyme family protein
MTARNLFDTAIEVVLEHEGYSRLTNDSADSGGATKWGISLRFLQRLGLEGDVNADGAVDEADVKGLTRQQAVDFYRAHWWDRYKYDLLDDPLTAVKVFDLAINMGPSAAHRCLQRALRANHLTVTEDGILGRKTRTAANAITGGGLAPALRSEAAGFYRGLVAKHPKLKRFLNGWISRGYY